MRNLQEQVKKAFCYQKLFWPFTVWINCSSDLKNFANSRPSASNSKSFSRSLEQFFLTVGKNNSGNKIPLIGCKPGFFCFSLGVQKEIKHFLIKDCFICFCDVFHRNFCNPHYRHFCEKQRISRWNKLKSFFFFSMLGVWQ